MSNTVVIFTPNDEEGVDKRIVPKCKKVKAFDNDVKSMSQKEIDELMAQKQKEKLEEMGKS